MEARTPDLRVDFTRYACLTADLPAVSGALRTQPSDFQVDEVPGQPPAGEGEHLLLHVRKTGWTTRAVVDRLREGLGLTEDQIGWAGLKDRHAVTTQWISVPRAAEAALPSLPEGVEILARAYHVSKLQEGHLAGNKFRILLRGASDEQTARKVLAVLSERGVPNYFGPQRFGRDGHNPSAAWKLIQKGRGRSKRWLDKLQLNSLQSLVFNDWLALRLERGLFDDVLAGDVAHKYATGGKFLVGEDELEPARERARNFEIGASGPLLGRKYHEAQGAARALEDEVLATRGLTRADFGGLPGSRRPIRWPLGEATVEASPEGLWLSFYLPRGGYATAVLREVMKQDVPADAPEDGVT